ncbi:hypothetical protein [Chromobacterium sphagni]|nr:hypothetical protein [Chromobacterium sphagni]
MNDVVNEAVTSLKKIGSLKELWLTVVGERKDSVNDVMAMHSAYSDMSFSLKIQDLANVFSGVYLDTYWTGLGESSNIMAEHLSQALGTAMPDAIGIARNSVAQWRGLLCRKNLSDSGLIPARGAYTDSMDIVCNRDVPLDPKQLIIQWDDVFYKTPQVGKNYIYARCQNKDFDGKIRDAQVRMYYSPGGFNTPPSSWVKCLTDVKGQFFGSVLDINNRPAVLDRGDRGVSEAFVLDVQSTAHICIAAAISYPYFEKNIPEQISTGNWNAVTWIMNNGAAAWRNVNPVLNQGDESLVFHNQDATPEQFSFVLRCQHVPFGSKLRMYSEDPAAAFDSGMVNIVNDCQELQVSVVVPPYYAGRIKLHLEGPDGKPLPRGAAVEIRMLWCVPHSHHHYLQAVALLGAISALPTLQSVHVPLGYYTMLGIEE